MVLALAAICGAAAAFAAIAYRQTVGESIIKLGEEISGEQRANGAGDASPQSATPPDAKNPQTTKPAPDTARPANQRPPATQPAPTSPITQVRPQTLQQSSNPQAELAAGRLIVPGTPKHLPEDVAALWVAVGNGDANAEVRLANRYISGDGVAKNCDQARVLLQAAGKRGNELATRRLTELSQVGCQ
jgi:TPR repeat protein